MVRVDLYYCEPGYDHIETVMVSDKEELLQALEHRGLYYPASRSYSNRLYCMTDIDKKLTLYENNLRRMW